MIFRHSLVSWYFKREDRENICIRIHIMSQTPAGNFNFSVSIHKSNATFLQARLIHKRYQVFAEILLRIFSVILCVFVVRAELLVKIRPRGSCTETTNTLNSK